MKYRRILALIMALGMLLAFAGCKNNPAEPENTALELTDMTGREVKIKSAADRLVVLGASDCEILYAIGAGEKIVGRGEYCSYPEEILETEAVSSGSETNIEQIIALEPDVVVMTKMAQTIEQNEALENAGIPVVVTDAQDIDGVYADIELLGKLTGKTGEATELINEMKAIFDGISHDGEGKTIYLEVSPLEYGLWTAGTGTFMNEIAEKLGLENIFADVEGWAEISEEQVIDRDPDYIVTVSMYFGEGPTPVEEIMGRDGWQEMKAVVNENVIQADSDMLSVPGPRLADAAKELYDSVYGE